MAKFSMTNKYTILFCSQHISKVIIVSGIKSPNSVNPSYKCVDSFKGGKRRFFKIHKQLFGQRADAMECCK